MTPQWLPLVFAALLVTTPAASQRPDPAAPAQFSERQAAWEQHQAMAGTSLFAGLKWRSVGPVVQGGRVVDIEVVPGQPFSYYVAYASGGLWFTSNNGHTFEPLFDDQPTIIMGDLAIAPSQSSTIWVGTGENNSSRSSYGGYGVFRSTDAGRTWQHRGLGESDRIGRILIDPTDPKRVYVAALGKLYTDGGQRGVYRTTDGGATWKQVLAGEGYVGAIDLAMNPTAPGTLYAAMWERSRRPWNFVEGGAGSGIWKSTDGGDSWQQLRTGLPSGAGVGRIGLSLCHGQPQTIYASVDNQEQLPESEWDLGGSPVTAKRLRSMTKEQFLAHDKNDIEAFIQGSDLDTELDAEKLMDMIESDELTLADLIAELGDANAQLFDTDIRGLEVYRSDDGGNTWKRTHQEPLLQVVHTYGYYFGLVRVSPTDPERVYVAGVPLLMSTDGGATFGGINGLGVHVDHHELWIDPNYPQRIITGNDGGLDVSYDHGETWRKVDAQAVGQFYTVAVDNATPYNIYGGLQDNGTLKGSSRSRPGLDEWSFVGGGDGMHVQVDPRDGTLYFGYQFGFYNRKDPNGSRHTVRPRDALREESFRYNWSTPLLLSPHNQDIVYFGTQKLLRSMDKGETWTAVSNDLSRSDQRGNVPFASMTSISESQLEFGLLWVGSDDGHVYVTEDGGKQWTDVSAGIPADRWVTRVVASQHERKRAFLTLSGYRDDDIRSYVYMTEDLGASWTSLAAGLPAEPVNVIHEDPVTPEVLYVGTDRGVYASLDLGNSWQALASGIPSVPVHDLVVHPRDRELVAGTHGRSVYVLDALPIQEATKDLREEVVHVFPLSDISYSRGWRSRRSLWFDRPEFHPDVQVPFWSKGAGTAVIEVLNDDGDVLRRAEMAVAAGGMHTYTWDLLLDEQRALAVERAREAKANDEEAEAGAGDDIGEGKDEPGIERGTLAQTPWAEAVRLGYPLYVTPGSYKVRVTIDAKQADAKLKVKAPSDREPRRKKEAPIRGRKRS
ncbi:MAG: glycosyl hydrolase [Planctomycetota bacterium]